MFSLRYVLIKTRVLCLFPNNLAMEKTIKVILYWRARYGVKSYFKFKVKHWVLVEGLDSTETSILDRVLFRHVTKDIYLLADAYDGEEIKTCIERFLESSNSQKSVSISMGSRIMQFGDDSDLIAYVGHDGLMDYDVNVTYMLRVTKQKDMMIMACYNKHFFSNETKAAEANPVLWTTHLLAPEAYSLKSAIDGWINNEAGK